MASTGDENLKNPSDDEKSDDTGLAGLTGGASLDPDINTRDKLLQQLHPNIREQLANHSWEIIRYDPIKLLIAHTGHNQIINASIISEKIKDIEDNEQQETVHNLSLHDIIIGAIPTEVTVHENPLGISDNKYSIKFFTHTNHTFTIGPKSLEEIVSLLREKALVFVSRGALESLAIIISAFAKNNKLITKVDVEAPGFYFVDGVIRGYHTEHPKPRQEEIQRCIDVLDELAAKYKRKDVFSTVVKWSIMTPFDFCLKQSKGVFIPWLHLFGFSYTGKTSLGDIPLAIWSKYQDRNYKIPFTSIDTVAKFGEVLSRSTYPITVNEVGALNDDRYKQLVEMFKNAI